MRLEERGDASAHHPETTRHRQGTRWPSIVLLVLSGLLVLSVLYLLAAPVDPGDFQDTTGVSWDGFAAANPEVAEYLARETRLLAVGYLGCFLFAVAIVWSRLRAGEPWAVRVLWILPAIMGLAAVVFVLGDGAALAAYYALGAVIAAGSILGAHRRLARPAEAGPP